ncbi:hypothetical protein W824_09440 [Clavibacter cf. michiganensis LMG 26808]|nr:hypothetical protein W824_09440 [Clavibacter cf. michiganensis LMG 26808]
MDLIAAMSGHLPALSRDFFSSWLGRMWGPAQGLSDRHRSADGA